jgi:hypothetical protein
VEELDFSFELVFEDGIEGVERMNEIGVEPSRCSGQITIMP